MGPKTMIVDAYPRPEVSSEEYGQLEARAMQLYLQLPYNDLGKCLIVMDILREHLRRRVADERLTRHPKTVEMADRLVNDGTVVRMFKD